MKTRNGFSFRDAEVVFNSASEKGGMPAMNRLDRFEKSDSSAGIALVSNYFEAVVCDGHLHDHVTVVDPQQPMSSFRRTFVDNVNHG